MSALELNEQKLAVLVERLAAVETTVRALVPAVVRHEYQRQMVADWQVVEQVCARLGIKTGPVVGGQRRLGRWSARRQAIENRRRLVAVLRGELGWSRSRVIRAVGCDWKASRG